MGGKKITITIIETLGKCEVKVLCNIVYRYAAHLQHHLHFKPSKQLLVVARCV